MQAQNNPRHQLIVPETKHHEPISSEMLLRVCLGQKNIHTDFNRKKLFWTLFSEEGIPDSERGAIWCKLLKIDDILERQQGLY